MSSNRRINKIEEAITPADINKITVRICCCDALPGEDHDIACPCSEFNGHEGVIRIRLDERKAA